MKKTLLLVMLLALLQAAVAPAEYLVGEGDVLRISVYDHPDLDLSARVNSDGTILFPLIKPLRISGMSVGQVAAAIADALAEGYIVNPQVSVFIEEFRSRKAVIIGQVKNPGLYELSGPTTLLELISKAGGLTSDAGRSVTIKRLPDEADGNAGEVVVTVTLDQMLKQGEPSPEWVIRDGDSIMVNEAGTVYVTGEVRRPDLYRLEEGASVIKVVTLAGGFTDLAAKRRIKIIRKVGNEEKVLENVSLHSAVLPEDVIVVPESFF